MARPAVSLRVRLTIACLLLKVCWLLTCYNMWDRAEWQELCAEGVHIPHANHAQPDRELQIKRTERMERGMSQGVSLSSPFPSFPFHPPCSLPSLSLPPASCSCSLPSPHCPVPS
ncbi:hypothetical protein B0H13DRAFT_1960271, partial [Mycena leptocephala]